MERHMRDVLEPNFVLIINFALSRNRESAKQQFSREIYHISDLEFL